MGPTTYAWAHSGLGPTFESNSFGLFSGSAGYEGVSSGFSCQQPAGWSSRASGLERRAHPPPPPPHFARLSEFGAAEGRILVFAHREAKSVVLGLLQLEPRQRIDLATLNRHEWISEADVAQFHTWPRPWGHFLWLNRLTSRARGL